MEVSGRTYPVECTIVRWVKTMMTKKMNLNTAIIRAVDEILATPGAGDTLVFLPGEREIRHAAEALRKHAISGIRKFCRCSRGLSVAEQDRVFKPGAARRIILATNVAETSLTVPRHSLCHR